MKMTEDKEVLKEQAFRIQLAKLKHSWDEYEMESETFGRMLFNFIEKHDPKVNVIGKGVPTAHKWRFNHNGILTEVPVDAKDQDS